MWPVAWIFKNWKAAQNREKQEWQSRNQNWNILIQLIKSTNKAKVRGTKGSCNAMQKSVLPNWHVGNRRLDVLRLVNNLARSITKWTKACDRRLSRLISYIHPSRETRQHCRMGLCEDSDFAVEDSKSSSGSVLCQKLLSRTAPQSLRSFLWMLDFAWLGHLLSVFGTW